MHTDGYVVGGTDAIVSTFFGNAQDPMFERDANGNPGCFMHRQASFIPGFWPEEAKEGLGTETTSFPFPSNRNQDYHLQHLVLEICGVSLMTEMPQKL